MRRPKPHEIEVALFLLVVTISCAIAFKSLFSGGG
jgi:hypothetical protein